MTDHDSLQLEHFLPYRLSILSNRVSAGIAREYQDRFHLSMTEWRVMAVLARFDGEGLSARAVADYTEMDKVAVSRALARLVAAGRVHRNRHAGDKRRSVLALTPAGWKIHAIVAPLARSQEQALIALLSKAELQSLVCILDKLAPVASGNADTPGTATDKPEIAPPPAFPRATTATPRRRVAD